MMSPPIPNSATPPWWKFGYVWLIIAGPAVVVDAQGLRVLDSSAVAVLLALRRELQAAGRSFSLRHPPARLNELLSLYGVSDLLPT